MANETLGSAVNSDPRAVAPACFSREAMIASGPCRGEGCAAAVAEHRGRWFITMGHPGYNSIANNRSGYATEAAARAAVRLPRLRGWR